jgi:hypothetical protein
MHHAQTLLLFRVGWLGHVSSNEIHAAEITLINSFRQETHANRHVRILRSAIPFRYSKHLLIVIFSASRQSSRSNIKGIKPWLIQAK